MQVGSIIRGGDYRYFGWRIEFKAAGLSHSLKTIDLGGNYEQPGQSTSGTAQC